MRDTLWLENRLHYIWSTYFADVPEKNRVIIRYGRRAKYQFGVISYSRESNLSVIKINRMFSSETVPVEVVDHTIAHELAHYAHGFSSSHDRAYHHPHQGGVVDQELARRGLSSTTSVYKAWLKEYRQKLKDSIKP